jgi:hypothetical protein
MGVMYPLAIVNTASITSLVRTTLYQHSIRVYPTTTERNEGALALAGKAPSAAAEFVGDNPGVRTVKDQMAIESETKVLL